MKIFFIPIRNDNVAYLDLFSYVSDGLTSLYIVFVDMFYGRNNTVYDLGQVMLVIRIIMIVHL